MKVPFGPVIACRSALVSRFRIVIDARKRIVPVVGHGAGHGAVAARRRRSSRSGDEPGDQSDQHEDGIGSSTGRGGLLFASLPGRSITKHAIRARAKRRPLMAVPFTEVPLMLPRSSTITSYSVTLRIAWIRDISLLSMRIVASLRRPTLALPRAIT